MIAMSYPAREPLALLRSGFDSEDWVAVFMKSYQTGESAQRVVPLSVAVSPRFLAFLRARNAARWEIYCGTNAVSPNQGSRTRAAIHAVRHLFLEADRDGQGFLGRIAARPDLPPPSYILRTSLDRVHALWRVRRFAVDQVEHLQKHLARELGADLAATSAAQTSRLPGFFNHKRDRPFAVTLGCGAVGRVFEPADFPTPKTPRSVPIPNSGGRAAGNAVSRGRAYLRSVPPAVEGEGGDAHTFRVCCRLVRGFALEDEDAMCALSDWNARCQPPWSERELRAKLGHARRYGREPFGRLLNGPMNYTIASNSISSRNTTNVEHIN